MINIGIGIPFGQRSAGIDPQAKIAFDSLQSAGFTTPQGITGINAAFKTIKTIYGTSDITTAISFFGDPSLAYQIGAGSGTTLGQAIRTLPNIIDPTRATDAVQTTAASQPLLLVHSGANYFFSPDASGNNCTSPNAVVNQISGNLEIICNVNITNSNAFNITKIGNYAFYKSTNNSLILNVNGINYTSTAQLSVFGDVFLKVTRESSNGNITFFTSTNGIDYTQLGLTISGLSGAMSTSTNQIIVCNQAVQSAILAKVFRVTISNSIGGAPVVDFNPNQYNPSTSQTQWTSSTGEVWSLNVGTATSGYKGALVTKTIIQGDGVDDRLFATNFTSRTAYTVYIAMNTLSFAGRPYGGEPILTKTIFGFSNNISMYGGTGSFDFAGEVSNRLQMLTANFQASPNVYSRINNNARQTTAASIGNAASTGINIFTDGGGANHANVIMSTLIQSTTNDPLNDNMYNYIRSINNNAF